MNIKKEILLDLSLNMARMINAQIRQEHIDLCPDSYEISFKTKSYEVKFVVSEKEKSENEARE